MWTVIDLFSGAGGMSYGFHAHPAFRMVAAVDAEYGKPSTGHGALQCNSTYEANIGIKPMFLDIGVLDPRDFHEAIRPLLAGHELTVMIACPPCTGFSRANSQNHVKDDPRNSLVSRMASFVAELRPQIMVMENARELISGNFSGHYLSLKAALQNLGYKVNGTTHMLTRFGLPQQRERAIVIAVRTGLTMRTLEDLWSGFAVAPNAVTVRRAIADLPPVASGSPHPDDPAHVATKIDGGDNLRRLRATPHDGGSWNDLIGHPDYDQLLTPGMRHAVSIGRPNSFCDIYGRLWWDRPAATIKRECSHIGNGRYAHPEQDRICTVREMAILQGFPRSFRFVARSRKNNYRAVGDAVPPLVSYQLAHVCAWILSGCKPELAQTILPGTHLSARDIERAPESQDLFSLLGA